VVRQEPNRLFHQVRLGVKRLLTTGTTFNSDFLYIFNPQSVPRFNYEILLDACVSAYFIGLEI
jgi:hypothetical protein